MEHATTMVIYIHNKEVGKIRIEKAGILSVLTINGTSSVEYTHRIDDLLEKWENNPENRIQYYPKAYWSCYGGKRRLVNSGYPEGDMLDIYAEE